MNFSFRCGPALAVSALFGFFSLVSIAHSQATGAALQPTSPETGAMVEAMKAAYTGAFADRTVHYGSDGKTPRFLNRLVLEDSPYLKQHAHNPVDWHPWSPETLQLARTLDRPIFLSIGYATCHWCHVMEHESFDNIEIAEMLNERFIPIKVDREQNPDVDLLYMTALQLSADSAGWPLTGFLMPNSKPFFVTSYMRPEVLVDVINQVNTYWDRDRFELVLHSERLGNSVRNYMQAQRDAATVGQADIERSTTILLATLDRQEGGFGRAPKFPHEPELIWLLDGLDAAGNPEVERALRLTLEKMQAGGIHDQIGGGFHRYSTDNYWTIPHFEKMLYNQAQLLEVYARAATAFDEPSFARTARRIAEFVLRDMTSPDGLFTSGYDADSEGREGPFYLWNEAQIEAALEPAEAQWAKMALGIDDRNPNFEGENLPTFASDLSHRDDVLAQLEAVRRARIWPLLDDKRITAWNAQMIEAFAVAGEVMDRPDWIDLALKRGQQLWDLHTDTATFALKRFSTENRVSATEGVLPDYAYVVKAFVRLFDASGDRKWLERATRIATVMHQKFWDEDLGLYAEASIDDQHLFARPVSTNDGAQFSGAATAILAIIELGRRLEDPRLELRGLEGLRVLNDRAASAPTAHGTAWRANLRRLDPAQSVGGVAVTAAGTVRAKIDDGELILQIAEGWHINGAAPSQESLVGTKVTLVGQVADAVAAWPAPKITSLGFSDLPLETYDGALRLALNDMSETDSNRLSIHVQTCDKQRCLPPEVLRLPIPR